VLSGERERDVWKLIATHFLFFYSRYRTVKVDVRNCVISPFEITFNEFSISLFNEQASLLETVLSIENDGDIRPAVSFSPILFDLEQQLASPLFSMYSKDCEIPNGHRTGVLLDVETIRRHHSKSHVELRLPKVAIHVWPQHLTFYQNLMDLFVAPNPTASSSMAISCLSTVIVLHGSTTTPSAAAAPTTNSSSASTNASNRSSPSNVEVLYRLEVSNLLLFQATLVNKNKVGSLIYLNCQEMKLVDDDNAILLRKAETFNVSRRDRSVCTLER
jgi:hypothetical protein